MAEPESLHGIEFVVHENLLDKGSLSVVSKTQREKMCLVERLHTSYGTQGERIYYGVLFCDEENHFSVKEKVNLLLERMEEAGFSSSSFSSFETILPLPV
ncbi:hypothetical protein, partial [Halomonas llamarensis]